MNAPMLCPKCDTVLVELGYGHLECPSCQTTLNSIFLRFFHDTSEPALELSEGDELAMHGIGS